jgi:cyclic-di-GMP phosphodiesterase, flagellum assembly factor TipF
MIFPEAVCVKFICLRKMMRARHAAACNLCAGSGKLVKKTGAELLEWPRPPDPVPIRFVSFEGRSIMPSTHKAKAQSSTTPSGGDGLVLVCMALVVAAFVVGLHIQLGAPLGAAAFAGMSLFVGLVGFQTWRRGEAERAILSSELQRLEAELVRGRVEGGFTASAAEAPAPVVATMNSAPAHIPADNADLLVAVDLDDADALARAYSGEAEAPQFEAYRRAPVVPQGESLGDYWQEPTPAAAPAMAPMRPEPAYIPDAGRTHGGQPSTDVEREAAVATGSSAVREDDVEMLQRRIKDMLSQVTAAEQARDLAAVGTMLPDPRASAVAAPVLDVETSLDALNAAVQSMRKTSGAVLPDGPHIAPEVPSSSPADPQLMAVRDAIAAGRVDVFLEPILGLGNQTAQHYEVSIKLRGLHAQDLEFGESGVIAGRGLLPLFDAVRIERSAIVAERLASRGKSGAVFSRASGEALIEPEFTRNMQMDFVARPATARQLILTFAQSDIRSFRAAEQRAVSALSALGFRFAISALTDLDMNFSAMANAGFGFVKLDASVLMDGLPHPGGHIPAGDVCRFLADQGFGLIVEGIDSEETLARVFGFGVLMGQGTLFGGRRPVKADVAGKPGQAAA